MSPHRKTNLKRRKNHVHLTGAFKGAARGAGGEAEQSLSAPRYACIERLALPAGRAQPLSMPMARGMHQALSEA